MTSAEESELRQTIDAVVASGTPLSDSDQATLQRLILDGMTEGVSLSDETGRILYTNASEDRLFGYARGELIGQHVTIQNNYPQEENDRRVRDVMEWLSVRGFWEGEWWNRRKDGTPFYTRSRISAVELNGRRCWLCIQSELAERHHFDGQFQVLADFIPNLAWMAHPDGYVFWFNRRWYEYTGKKTEEVQGWGWASVHDPGHLPRVLESWQKSIRSGDPFEMTFPLRSASGDFSTFLTRVVPLKGPEGKVERWFATHTDISSQEEAERALRSVEQQLVLVVETSGALLRSLSVQEVLTRTIDLAPHFILSDACAIWRVHTEGHWRAVAASGLSDNYLQTARDMAGDPPTEIVIIEDIESEPLLSGRVECYRAEQIRSMVCVPLRIGGEVSGVLVFYFRTPRVFSEGERIVASALGNVTAAALGSAEIYEREAETRRRAEAGEEERRTLLAREQEARFTAELLNRVGPLLLAELDRDRLVGKLIEICTRLVGAETGILAGDRKEYTAQRHEDIGLDPQGAPLFPPAISSLRSVLAVPVNSHTGESFGTLLFGHSQPGVFSGRHQQLAEGIAAQAAVALDNARLFSEAIRVGEALHRANDSLRSANADLEQFAFAAAHDLREPLRIVTSYTQLLERKLRSQLDGEARLFMDQVVVGARRMEDLLQDLLSYTNTATQHEVASRLELGPIVKQALVYLQSRIAEAGAEIRVGPMPVISGRATHLLLIFQNLIGNAIKYRRKDVAPVVEIRAERSQDVWTFSVKDNGIGIEARYRTQIFGVFKRLHGREIPGTGIGLAICQRAVERCGGRIWVESTPGEGSTFFFTLPASAESD